MGFVLFAFPWSEPGTELANSIGPRDWQRELLAELGRRLREGHQLANLLPILMARASGHGGRKVDCCGLDNPLGPLDDAQRARCRTR
jgi:hypothetical protein